MKLAELSDLATTAIQRGAYQKPAELQQLIEFMQGRAKPKNMLEIGTAKGGTLWLWCQLAHPQARIISVDLPDGPFGGGYQPEDIPRLLTYSTNHQWIQLFRGDSHNPQMFRSVKRFLNGEKLDLLFIDGDHTYEGVKEDWDTYSPLVAENGIVVFHDIVEHTAVPDCDVTTLWNELKRLHKTEEFIDPSNGASWAGIGVIDMGGKHG